MAYQALYRKYRPQTFSDVVGQEHVTKTLKEELAHGKIVHAYLFTGTRGTGKTSCAKILAKAVNCLSNRDGEPCLECENCLRFAADEATDIVEIDAASNRGIDNIRELRDMVKFAPTTSKYRVYIIDEVHMLSIEAFNAFLKTLEEPPPHVIFILATTEVHKLPATILSRCQRFDFRRIDSEKICERIQYVASKEGLAVTNEAAMLIAAAADGGMRDALSILDLCASGNKNIDEATVESVCAMAGNDYLLKLADCINKRDSQQALLLIDSLHNSSVDMLRLLTELTRHFRDLMIVKTVKGDKKPIVCSKKRMEALEKQAADFDIKEIIHCLTVLQYSFSAMQTGNRRTEMEMAIIKLCNPSLSVDLSSLERRIQILEQKLSYNSGTHPAAPPQVIGGTQEETPEDTQDEDIPLPTEEYVPPEVASQTNKKDDSGKAAAEDNAVTPVAQWDEIMALIRAECPLLFGVLNDSAAYIKGNYLLIDAKNDQFRSLINSGNPLYKDAIRKAVRQVLGVTYRLGPYKKQTVSPSEDPLAAFAEKLKQFEIN